jgi:hypothetical protein
MTMDQFQTLYLALFAIGAFAAAFVNGVAGLAFAIVATAVWNGPVTYVIMTITTTVFEYSPTTPKTIISHFPGPSGEDFKSKVFEGGGPPFIRPGFTWRKIAILDSRPAIRI